MGSRLRSPARQRAPRGDRRCRCRRCWQCRWRSRRRCRFRSDGRGRGCRRSGCRFRRSGRCRGCRRLRRFPAGAGAGDRPRLLLVILGVDGGAGVDPLDREVLAERVPVEALPEEDAGHVGMAREAHPVHVVDLALRPVGGAPDAAHRGHGGGLVGRHLQADAPVGGEAVQVVDDVEARRPLGEVGAADVDQIGELVPGLERPGDLGHSVAPEDESEVAGEAPGRLDRLPELLLERLDQGVRGGILPLRGDRIALPGLPDRRGRRRVRRRLRGGHRSGGLGDDGSGCHRGGRRRRSRRSDRGDWRRRRRQGGRRGCWDQGDRWSRRGGRDIGGFHLTSAPGGGSAGLFLLVAHEPASSAGSSASVAFRGRGWPAMLMRSILRCRWRRPQSRASGRGGQPGT